METILPGARERTRAAHPARIVTGLVPRAPRPRLRLGVLVAALVTATAFNVGPTAAAASTAARHVGGAVAVHAGSSLSLTGFAPASGPVGTKVTLSGTGFTSSDVVAFNGTNASTQHVNKAGTQLVTQVPPLSTSGPITVTDPATGQTAGLPGTAFQVTTGIAAFPGQVWPGERFTFAGSALTPNSGETLMLDSTVLGDARTDSHGNVATPFTLPWHTKPGQHTISLVDPTYGVLKNALPVLSSWPQIGAVPARTFNNTGEWLLPPSKLASVSKKLGIAFVGLIRSSAIVAGGLMYIPYGSKLTAENALTGVPAWTFTAGDDINTTPAVDSGLIYFGSLDGNLYVLDALTGVYKWRTTLGNSYSSPLVNKGVLYFGTDTGFLYALNATTGGFLWDYQTGGQIASPPSIAKGILYFGSDDDYIYALKASTGQFIWRFKTCIDPNNPTCYPDELPVSVAGGVAVEPSSDGFVYGLNASNGTYEWSVSEGAVYAASEVAVASGVVYFTSSQYATVQALRLSDGAQLWSYPCSEPSFPSYADGVLYVPCLHTLLGFDVVHGGSPWTWTLPGNDYFLLDQPTIAGGRIYLIATNGATEDWLYSLGT